MKTTSRLGLGVFTSVICLLVAACGSSDSSETPAAGGTGATSGSGGASGKGGSAGVGGGGTGGVAGKGGTSGSSGTAGTAGTAGVAGTGGSAGATCGNSKVESPEECDQGTSNSDTGACTTKCKSAKCGDSLVQDGVEDCDQGASNSDTGSCTTKCKSAKCGDSLVQTGTEECDQGAANADTGACTSTCKNAKCGDNLVQAGVEGCDLGAANSDTGACTSQCKSAKCGDSLVQATVEECDLGAANSDTGACTSLCKNAACGDGLLQTGVEECDQGTNNNDQGACTLQCKNAKCGDGLTEIGVEECDQGTNNNDQGACTVACKSAKCGDSLLHVGVEECDLGANNSNTGNCTTLCKNAVCGDGFIKAGSTEACDDGNQVNGDGCNNDCVVSGTPLFTKSDQTADAWYGATKDPSGNIIVTGAVFVTGQGQNAITQKLDANGNILWTRTYNAPANGNDAGNAVATDTQGNVIVVGNLTSSGGGTDILVIKYDASGNQVWIQAYTGDTANAAGNDYGFGVATNAAGDIFLTGAVFPSSANYDVIVAKLAGVNGSLVWPDVVNGTASSSDFGAAIAVDGANVLVTGGIRNGASADIWVRKYADAGATMSVVWTRTSNGLANGDDYGSGIATDTTGNVFVSGSETVTGHAQDIWLRKYDAAGNVAWTAAPINGPGNLADEGLSVKVDSLGAIVVGGYVTNSNNTTDAWVQKYSSAGVALGAPAWPRTYNGAADGDDVVNAVVIDSTDFIYGVGTETISSTNLNGWIRKFAP